MELWSGMMVVTIWLFNIAMENDPFIDDFPIKTSIYSGFSMAMLNNQMVGGNIEQWVLSYFFDGAESNSELTDQEFCELQAGVESGGHPE